MDCFGPPPTLDHSASVHHISPCSRLLLLARPPAAKFIFSRTFMNYSKNLARLLLLGGENAHLISTTGLYMTAWTHKDNIMAKTRTDRVIVSFSLYILLNIGIICSEKKGSHKWVMFCQGWEFVLPLADSTWLSGGIDWDLPKRLQAQDCTLAMVWLSVQGCRVADWVFTRESHPPPH